MNTIVVDADNNNIKINGKPSSVTMTSLFNEFNEKFGNGKFFRANNFRQLNQLINRGDCIKDGTNGATITNFGLFDVNNTFSLDQLKNLAHAVIEKYREEGVILRQVFTKDKKGDDSVKEKYNGLTFDIGFDSGLGLNNFLMTPQYKIIDTFGKYIDPSSARDSNGTFPEKKILVITKNAFNMLGYDNCSIDSAIQKGKDQYDYTFNLEGSALSNNGKSRQQDSNIKIYFPGNKVKNSVNATTDVKKARIVGKSLGDKLQVFIMYVKKIEEQTQTKINVISTCDEIVLLFCILLKLPCFYTSNDVEKKIKIKEVLYYNVDNTSSDTAMTRFESEKKVVLKGYSSMISMIEKIRKNNSPLKTSSDNRIYTVSPKFTKGLIDDLTDIKNNIEQITVGENDTDISKINNLTQQIKSMTINNFIRENKGAGASGNSYIIGVSAKKYTRYEPPQIKNTAYGKVNLLRELNMDTKDIDKNINLSFFELLKRSQTPPTPLAQGGNNTKLSVRFTYRVPNEKIIFKNIQDYFNTDEITVYIKEDEIDYSKVDSTETPEFTNLVYYDKSSFDANKALLDTLYVLYKQMDTTVPFEDVYSEMLCLFNSDPNYYTDHLRIQMYNIIQELSDTYTVQEIAPVPISSKISSIRKFLGTRKNVKTLASKSTRKNRSKELRKQLSIKQLQNRLATFSAKRFPNLLSSNSMSI